MLNIFEKILSKGSVFAGKFDNIEHEKYFIVAGLSYDKVYVCSVYINSNIPNFIKSNQKLLNLQVPIKGNKYDFLTHLSFVSCNNPLKYMSNEIKLWFANGKCRYIGQIDKDDLNNITDTIIASGLLTQKEMDIYFKQ
jgi:hypothetical protein